MGFDEENLEPKPRKLNKKNVSIKDDPYQPKSFCVIYENEKRQLTATSRSDLLKNVSVKLGIDADSFKFEFWSSVFQEWILLDENQLPDDNSKIQISPKSPKQEKKTEECEPMFTKNSDFISLLNASFQKYIESDDEGGALPAFETAIIFVLKRKPVADYLSQQQHEQSHLDTVKVNARLDQVERTLRDLEDDVSAVKSSVKQIKSHLDDEETKKVEMTAEAAAAPVSNGNGSSGTDENQKNKKKKKKKIKPAHSCSIC